MNCEQDPAENVQRPSFFKVFPFACVVARSRRLSEVYDVAFSCRTFGFICAGGSSDCGSGKRKICAASAGSSERS